jgi:serine protease Do
VDARGELIGINTFLISSSGSFSGMGFAIPSQIVQPTVEALIRDGKVTHGFIGIQISDVTPDNAKFFQMNQAVGAIVSEVGPDTPAAKAGLRTGDVITELDGKPVTDAGQLQMTVGQKRPGDTIHLLVVRDSKPTNIAVTLAALGNGKGTETAAGDHGKARWGLSLADLTPEVRNELQTRKSVQGAMVEEVQPGSPADNAGLQRGDVIMEVNRHAVKSSAEVAEALSSVPSGQDALVLVWSNGGSTFRVLHPAQG